MIIEGCVFDKGANSMVPNHIHYSNNDGIIIKNNLWKRTPPLSSPVNDASVERDNLGY